MVYSTLNWNYGVDVMEFEMMLVVDSDGLELMCDYDSDVAGT